MGWCSFDPKQSDNQWQPIAYASRAMNFTETRYAQIEKEALAITYACGRCQEYLIGWLFYIHTDHKPLVPIFSNKSLNKLPLRVQCFRLRLLSLHSRQTTDTLPCAPLSHLGHTVHNLQQDCDVYVALAVESFPATEARLQQIRDPLNQHNTSKALMQFCN